MNALRPALAVVLTAALVAGGLAPAGCRATPPTPAGSANGASHGSGRALTAPTAGASGDVVAALRQVVRDVAAAGADRDVAACRAHLSGESRRLLTDLFRETAGDAGWEALCAAHAELAWPADAVVTASANLATVEGSGPGGPLRVTFLREDDAWRLHYAGHADAAALRTLPSTGRR